MLEVSSYNICSTRRCSDRLYQIMAVSTGLRFTTLPDATPPSSSAAGVSSSEPSQPPTTLTAIFNPMMGHLSTAYAARVSRDLALCSRFDFNMYSYESEWTMGAEWWIRRGLRTTESGVALPKSDEVQGVVKARVSTSTVSDNLNHFDAVLRLTALTVII